MEATPELLNRHTPVAEIHLGAKGFMAAYELIGEHTECLDLSSLHEIVLVHLPKHRLPSHKAALESSQAIHTIMSPLSSVVYSLQPFTSNPVGAWDSPLLGRMYTPSEIADLDFPFHP
jgi:hypothetical protein